MKEKIKLYNSFINIFSQTQKIDFLKLLIFSIIAMALETVSIASIFPFLEHIFSGTSILNNFEFIFLKSINSEKIGLVLLFTFIIIFLIKSFFLTFFSYKKNKFIYDIRIFQTNNLFQSYMYDEYLFHIKNNSSILLRNLNDANLLSVFTRSLIDLAAEIIMLLGILIFLIIISPQITLTTTVFFGLIGLIFYKFVQSKAAYWGERSKNFRGLKLKNIRESFGAIREIKVLQNEKNFIKIFSNNNYFENQLNKKHSFVQSLPKIWFELLAVIIFVIILIYLSNNESSKLNIIPYLGVFTLAAYKILPSITKISINLQDIKFCLPAIKPYLENKYRIHENSKVIKAISYSSGRCSFKSLINIENLEFSYPETKRKVFTKLNFSLKKNDFIGILGKSGEGKTTFVNLMSGLLKPNNGKIFVDGINIYKNLNKWQRIISYIPQNVFITDDKIINNVALGEDEKEINYDKVMSCLSKAKIKDFISTLPKGIETLCGELGDRFSGGQKQRLAIARAFYNDAEILIFDEFTNFLDNESETKIMRDVSKLTDKTRIIVSHNLDVLSYCSKVYELKDQNLLQRN